MKRLTLVIAMGCFVATAAVAQTVSPHTIDMTVVLHDADGEPMKDPRNADPTDRKCEKCPTLTVGHLIANVLFNVQNRDAQGNVTDKPDVLWARAVLAEKIRDDKAAVLTRGYPSPLVILAGLAAARSECEAWRG